jgi:hypothetical protein
VARATDTYRYFYHCFVLSLYKILS